jgi:aromatic ring-opening dioxygenase catalytic subunit (LigB family)
MSRQPTLYIPHGGGPCFFMEWTMGPPDTWNALEEWLRGFPATLPEAPRALLVISAHWETQGFAVTTAAQPPLLYDYYGFPPHTYQLTWPAPGEPELARRVADLLGTAGFETASDEKRGFDHGVFVPLKVSFPEASIPAVQLSLDRRLDPAQHLALGRALGPLRDEGVLILGSGMSYHNMQHFQRSLARDASATFDAWLAESLSLPRDAREARLRAWAEAPAARIAHPREEHLLPLMVVAGAAGDDPAHAAYRGAVMSATVSAFRFG